MADMQSPRLPKLSENNLTADQRALAQSIASGPRGQFKMSAPFAIYLHSPTFGELAQKLGGHLRFKTSVSPRLSEFAILCTAQHWKAQYEWAMHAPMAEKAGVKPETIARHPGRPCAEKGAADEMAIYAFVKELYATKRVSTGAYNKVKKLLGDAGVVELVGILGYYAMVSMTLNTFKAPLPQGMKAPFEGGKIACSEYPDAVQVKRLHADPGSSQSSEIVTIPGLQRTTSCCAAPGKPSAVLRLVHRMRPALHHHGATAGRNAGRGGADGGDRIVDIHGAGGVELQRRLHGLALLQRVLEVDQHDVKAARLERHGLTRLDLEAAFDRPHHPSRHCPSSSYGSGTPHLRRSTRSLPGPASYRCW